MVALHKILQGWFGGILLVLVFFQAAHVYAETATEFEVNVVRSEGIIDLANQSQRKERLLMQGEVLRMEEVNNLIKDPNGKEPRLLLDPNTEKIGSIMLGNRLEGKVNFHNRVPTNPSVQVRDIVPPK
ncbi:MAG: hypothetical protein ACREJN_17730 [Nitrospiraceae bacterium]